MPHHNNHIRTQPTHNPCARPARRQLHSTQEKADRERYDYRTSRLDSSSRADDTYSMWD